MRWVAAALLVMVSGCAQKPTKKELADFADPYCAYLRHEAPRGWEGEQSSGVLEYLLDLPPKYAKTCSWRAVEDSTPTADPRDQQSHVIYLIGASEDLIELHVRYEGPRKGFRLLVAKKLYSTRTADDDDGGSEESEE
ncbi:MAG: hypothetical protein ACJ790_11380 [Myxococcaceae bacterium]